MGYVHFGRTGLKVSPLCLGTMNFGPHTTEKVSRFAVLVSDKDLAPESFREVFATPLAERHTYRLPFELEPVRARYVMLQTRDNLGGRWHEVAEFVVCAAESTLGR